MTTPVRFVARPLLGALFVTGGFDALRSPAPRVQAVTDAGLDKAEQLVRINGAAMLLGGLGLLMGAAGLPLFLWPGTPPPMVLAALFVLVGISASGWNGVMVAEISRIAGPLRAGAVTGAALLFGYSGIAIAPLAFAAMGSAGGTGTAFAVLLAMTGVMGISLLLRRRR